MLGQVSSAVASGDIIAALSCLNARVRFRYTGIFRVEPPSLINLRLFDRENPRLNVSGSVASLDIGYCGVTCATNAPFATSNAARDPRLDSHPARESMLSYAGVPIRLSTGVAWGTLCHFDFRPRLARESELLVLEAVVPMLVSWIQAHARVS